MNSEKMKEIKKALEDNANYEHHDKLGYIDGYKCKTVAYADILTLINELESENELLRNAKVVYETVDYCYEDLKKAEKRIAELEKGNEALSFAVKQGFNDCQTKTLKQFAERLKEKVYDSFGDKVIWYNDIDETLKEFMDGTNEQLACKWKI